MGKKTVDIDALIAENSLELIIGGTKYVVADIDVPTFIKANQLLEKDDDELTGSEAHAQLALMLGVEVESIEEKVGIKAAALAIGQITEWLMPETDEVDGEGAETEDP